jgi:N-acetyl-anhydromuramyl-L-alanine amidase AmpD
MRTARTRATVALVYALVALPAVAGTQAPDPAASRARLVLRQAAQPMFDEAGREFGVPPDLLRAYAFVHTHWADTRQGTEPAEGHMPALFGIMGLHDGQEGWFRDQVGMASERLGEPREQIEEDTLTNIRAAAALLRAEADARGITSDSLEAWAPAVEGITAIPAGDSVDRFARKSEVYEVLATLLRGYAKDGIRIPARALRLERVFSPSDLKLMRAPVVDSQVLAPRPGPGAPVGSDDPSALWNPTSCFSSRGGTQVTHVAIHVMQGYYAGTISWFKNCANQVSAHYLMRSSDGQITQMVHESDLAWHIASANPYTVGIEHEGFIEDASWFTTAMYESSAALTRRICQRLGIDYTKTYGGTFQGPLPDPLYTVKGHVHFANQTHIDPGVLWDWARYRQLVIGTPDRDAEVRDGESSVPAALRPGETRTVTVRVKNTGSLTWTAGEAFRLGAGPDNQLPWSGYRCGGYTNSVTDARAFVCADVPPGSAHDFTFDVTAPASGPARLSVRMVQDGVAWFGGAFSWSILVGEPRAAEVVAVESIVPGGLAPGVPRSAVVRVRNTGTMTWTADQAFRLGAAAGNTVAWSGFACGGYQNSPGDARVFLCSPVPPGGVYDFKLDLTAPAPGQAVLGVRMVQDGVAWFGDTQSWSLASCVRAVATTHWKGDYFANMSLAGLPWMTRDDGAGSLAFDVGTGSPSSVCGLPADLFSVRWTRTVSLGAGIWRFSVTSDDGFRLYVDGVLRLDRWRDQAPTTYVVDVRLAAGLHTLRLEYYEHTGGAMARLSWAQHRSITGPLP